MSEAHFEQWAARNGFAGELPEDDTTIISVLRCNTKIVEWFFDLESCFTIQKLKGRSNLIGPSKQEIFYSAKLIRLKYNDRQYDGLKLMLKTAIDGYR